MKKYEVRTFSIETKDGKNAFNKFQNQSNQDTRLEESFDTLEEAREFYKTIPTGCREIDGFGWGNKYYLHTCKCIEENEYDEDGEWVNGGDWWEYDIPEINE